MGKQRISNPAFFICDIQEKFRGGIWEYSKVIATTQKMIAACKILDIPIYNTTQNQARLGPTVPELAGNFPEGTTNVDKTAFSMLVPEVTSKLIQQASSGSTSSAPEPLTVILVGIETHICITQTTLDLLQLGHRVYILADGVSSINEGERGIALARLRTEGATVTTSESILFELVGDAADKNFKAIAGLVKETKEGTKQAVSTLCSRLDGKEPTDSSGGGFFGFF